MELRGHLDKSKAFSLRDRIVGLCRRKEAASICDNAVMFLLPLGENSSDTVTTGIHSDLSLGGWGKVGQDRGILKSVIGREKAAA